jgi:Lysylphosphatidylglycerol synthase TM region
MFELSRIQDSRCSTGRGCTNQRKRSLRRLIIPLAITAITALFVFQKVAWRDTAVLADTSLVTVIMDRGSTLVVSQDNGSGAKTTEIPRSVMSEYRTGFRSLLRRVRAPGILALIGVSFLTAIALVARWYILFSGAPIRPDLAWCANTWARGQVISVLPTGQIGGDVYRVVQSARFCKNPGLCAGVVITERLAGLTALALVACTGAAMSFGQPSAAAIPLAFFCFVSVLVVIARHRLKPGKIAACEGLGWLGHCIDQICSLSCGPAVFVRVLVLSIIAQLLTPLSFAIIDLEFGFGTPIWCYFVAIPAVTLVQFLPIHVAGLGILEGGLGVMLGTWAHRTPPEILAISAAARGASLIWLAVLSSSIVIPTKGANRVRGIATHAISETRFECNAT